MKGLFQPPLLLCVRYSDRRRVNERKDGKEAKEATETTEADIAVHWAEEQYFYPSTKFIAQANMTDENIYDRMSLDKCLNTGRSTPTC